MKIETIKNLSKEEFQKHIQELQKWEALEFCPVGSGQETSVCIPYVMNDSVECFIRMYNCRILGEVPTGKAPVKEIRLEDDSDRQGLLLCLTDQSRISIWYKKVSFEQHCYQYHRIGHKWRSHPGEEYLRRLVNLLCVLNDKYTYLGAEACNSKEIFLQQLIEFSPLCFWSPINESILSWYPETEAGILAMKQVAEEAEDLTYARLTERYLQVWKHPKKSVRLRKQLRVLLSEPEHYGICRWIASMLEQASLHWEERPYPDHMRRQMEQMRQDCQQKYLAAGYEGCYPRMKRKDPRRKCADLIFFAEEHPFTIMESEEYHFQIIPITLP